MTKNESIVRGAGLWGEDVHSLLSSAPEDPDLRERVEASYLMAIREVVTGNPDAKETVIGAVPASSAFDNIKEIMADRIRPETAESFDKALKYFLEELEHHRKMEPSSYIVDIKTGKAVVPLRPEHIFTPEGGKTKAVHPAISSSLALLAASANREEKIRRLASDPVSGLAFQHMTEPDKIGVKAVEKLEARGLIQCDMGESEVLVLGKENVEADLQSPNKRYHRLSVYSEVLYREIIKRAGRGGSFWVGKVLRRENSKQRWYEVEVRTSRAGTG